MNKSQKELIQAAGTAFRKKIESCVSVEYQDPMIAYENAKKSGEIVDYTVNGNDVCVTVPFIPVKAAKKVKINLSLWPNYE
jgi:hypothetical protein